MAYESLTDQESAPVPVNSLGIDSDSDENDNSSNASVEGAETAAPVALSPFSTLIRQLDRQPPTIIESDPSWNRADYTRAPTASRSLGSGNREISTAIEKYSGGVNFKNPDEEKKFFSDPAKTRGFIKSISEELHVPPYLLMGIIQTESNYHQWGKDGQTLGSGVGALGFAQLMPGTAKGFGKDPNDPSKDLINPNDPAQNLIGGAYFLKQMLAHYGGDPRKALAAYNWGPGNLDKKLAKYGGDIDRVLADQAGSDNPHPTPNETKNYVRIVSGYAQQFERADQAKPEPAFVAATAANKTEAVTGTSAGSSFSTNGVIIGDSIWLGSGNAIGMTKDNGSNHAIVGAGFVGGKDKSDRQIAELQSAASDGSLKGRPLYLGFGRNDAGANMAAYQNIVRANITKILQIAKTGDAGPLTILIPLSERGLHADQMEAVRAVYLKVASEMQLPVIDLGGADFSRSPDGVHPNSYKPVGEALRTAKSFIPAQTVAPDAQMASRNSLRNTTVAVALADKPLPSPRAKVLEHGAYVAANANVAPAAPKKPGDLPSGTVYPVISNAQQG